MMTHSIKAPSAVLASQNIPYSITGVTTRWKTCSKICILVNFEFFHDQASWIYFETAQSCFPGVAGGSHGGSWQTETERRPDLVSGPINEQLIRQSPSFDYICCRCGHRRVFFFFLPFFFLGFTAFWRMQHIWGGNKSMLRMFCASQLLFIILETLSQIVQLGMFDLHLNADTNEYLPLLIFNNHLLR